MSVELNCLNCWVYVACKTNVFSFNSVEMVRMSSKNHAFCVQYWCLINKPPDVTIPGQKGVWEPHLSLSHDSSVRDYHSTISTCVCVELSAMTVWVCVACLMGAGRLEMPRWWTSTFDWHRQPVPLVCIPSGFSLSSKLLPYSLLQQTDRYLLMNPHAPVTLASSEALGRAATSSQRSLLGAGGGLQWRGVGPKVKGGVTEF